jgi:putative membrane protein
MRSVFTIIIAFGLLVLVINLLRVIIRYYGFTINRQRGALLLSYGLLNTKSTIIRRERVQITTVTRNYFQRKMDILQIRIRQAGGETYEGKSAIDIPGCTETERDQILNLLYQRIPEGGVTLTPNFRKLVFSVFLVIVLPLTVFFYLGSQIPEVWAALNWVPLYVIFTGLLIWFGFRNNRIFLDDGVITVQSGAWDVSRATIETSKIQAVTTSQLFWHKKADIGSLILHTAGGKIMFQLGTFSTLNEYVNRWIYSIEKSNANWM